MSKLSQPATRSYACVNIFLAKLHNSTNVKQDNNTLCFSKIYALFFLVILVFLCVFLPTLCKYFYFFNFLWKNTGKKIFDKPALIMDDIAKRLTMQLFNSIYCCNIFVFFCVFCLLVYAFFVWIYVTTGATQQISLRLFSEIYTIQKNITFTKFITPSFFVCLYVNFGLVSFLGVLFWDKFIPIV